MTIILFSDQLPDLRGYLHRLQRTRNGTVLLSAFLEKAYAALREEVCLLPRASRAQIPAFNSVVDLSERFDRFKVRRLEVSSALLCICQLAYFIG